MFFLALKGDHLKRKIHNPKLNILISFVVHHKSFVDMVKIGFHSPKTNSYLKT